MWKFNKNLILQCSNKPPHNENNWLFIALSILIVVVMVYLFVKELS